MKKLLSLVLMIALCSPIWAQKGKKKKQEDTQKEEKTLFEKTSFDKLKFRSIGPAITSGRISDFAMHPGNPKTYYVAVSSGGVWKTTNAGNTYKPIFDNEGSYSTGVVTLDPTNPNVVWVGTGENNNQRSVAYGDGIYKSLDGGNSWKNMGLKDSEHIGSIVVHPDDGNTVFVAAIGPLWNEGGERGVYKTTDGGENWQRILEIDEHTGVNEVVMDPRNPDVLYAAAYQRRRHVFTYIGGGPGSSIYKSTDGGETWNKSAKGLPGGDLGRIGMAISPANPEYIYAIVEAQSGKGGVYRSTDRGASWAKRGGYSTSGNYYQEIIADPTNPDKLFAMDTWMKYSIDGGKTFSNVGEDYKHVDNHCMWIDPTDTDHWLVGCDGGIYETWDHAKNWHYKANLPITQYYKVAVDNAEPFYHIYGGTQDNFSMGGPSRTLSANGIANDEWYMTHGGDGFETQVDPHDPNIVFAQSQYGVLVRYDKLSGEELGIQPQPREGEDEYIWNWDAPLEISRHVPGRIYFAANKVFRSDDRGHSWEVISEDLSQQIDRNKLKVMGRVWEMDGIAKNGSTSQYGAVVAFSESAVDQNLLMAGTDDGLVHVTEDGGSNWRKLHIPGAPNQSYVNEVLASKHDVDVMFIAYNHHKYGDFKPYLFKSNDKGATWLNISNNLPERGSVYAIEQDHKDPNLLFVGTEFGVFFANDGGKIWKQLNGGVPTISVRDIAIQEREEDLVLGTFGRGFYVLDDYTPLRNMTNADLMDSARVLAVRDARQWEWATPYGLPGKAFQGDAFYRGENLGPEALITYYVKDVKKSLKDQRKEDESKLKKESKDIHYPEYKTLEAENNEEKASLYFIIRDSNNEIVRKLTASPSKGIGRISWDLRYAPKDPVSFGSPSFYNPFSGQSQGHAVAPGPYNVTMYLWQDREMKKLSDPVTFFVEPLNIYSLPPEDSEVMVAFKRKVATLSGSASATSKKLADITNEIRYLRKAIGLTETETEQSLLNQLIDVEHKIASVKKPLTGDRMARSLDLPTKPSIMQMIGTISYGGKNATSEPTATFLDLYDRAHSSLGAVIKDVNALIKDDLIPLRKAVQNAGAPYTPHADLELIKF